MLPPKFTLQDDFSPVGYQQWRELAEAALGGASFAQKLVTHTFEGIDLEPIYTRDDLPDEPDPSGFPGASPFVRGARPLGAVTTGWDLRPEHSRPDLDVAGEEIAEDVHGGATSLLLRLDQAACAGLDADDSRAAELAGRDGLMVYHVDDLEIALRDVPQNGFCVALDAGGAFLPAAAVLVAWWRRREISPDVARGAFNADPLAALVSQGQLSLPAERSLARMADLARWTAQHYPHVSAVGVNTAPYHDAGATAVQDIAFAMATAVDYLRAMTAAGMDIDAAAGQTLFRFSLGTHHFLAIAKLRAARRLWARIVQASGGSASAAAMRIHARTATRVLTRRDPYVNLLRNTASVFAAGIGGAEAITPVAWNHLFSPGDAAARRIARNTVLILQEEAHLHRVIDPAGGSWFVEKMTEQLAVEAWKLFQAIQRRGGMLKSVTDGWVAGEIAAAFAPRAKDIARRKSAITGVSEFPDVDEATIDHTRPDLGVLIAAAGERLRGCRSAGMSSKSLATSAEPMADAVEAAGSGATIGQISAALGFELGATTVEPLAHRRFAEPFEQLRDAADAWKERNGARPGVFLANLGSVSHHTARSTYAKNFFEAGGFEVIGNDGFETSDAAARAFSASGAQVAVICSSDQLYPEVVPPAARALKEAGARVVILAGRPGEHEVAWRAAGVDRFIFISCDVLSTLQELLQEEGVLAR